MDELLCDHVLMKVVWFTDTHCWQLVLVSVNSQNTGCKSHWLLCLGIILEGKNYFACSTCVATHRAVKDVRMVVTKITETEFSIQEKASDDGMQQ